jgi:hypothetical protein
MHCGYTIPCARSDAHLVFYNTAFVASLKALRKSHITSTSAHCFALSATSPFSLA